MTILFEDTGNGFSTFVNPSPMGACYVARVFQPSTAGLVTKITVEIYGYNDTKTYGVKMQLREEVGGSPSDDIAETSSTTLTYIADGWANYEFTFAGTLNLSDEDDYWAVIYRTDSNGTNILIRTDNPGGSVGKYDDEGVFPWSAFVHTLDVKVEGELAGGVTRSFGVII